MQTRATAPRTTRRPDRFPTPMSAETEFVEALDGIAPIAVRAAATLRLADHIAAGHDRVESLAEATGTDPDLLRRLLAFLAGREVFGEPAPGVFALTPLSVALLDGHPSRLRSWLDADGVGGRLDAAINGLLGALRSGRPPYPDLHGRPFYSDLAAAGFEDRSFDRLRGDHAAEFAGELVSAYPWPDAGHVVDVGGGSGVLTEALLRACPRLRATVVDLPNALSGVAQRFHDNGLGDRATAMPGDFFAALPPGADVYALVNVVHNWGDADAVRILRRCAEAGGSDSTVLVVERLSDRTDPKTATAMDLRAYLFLGGRERTHAQYKALAAESGLEPRAEYTVPGGLHLLAFEPAGPHGTR